MGAKNKSNEIRILRQFDAPVKTVWEAWTDPAQVGQWWGPRGFTITTHSRDLRSGGSWRYTMHGPDGTQYENTTKYLEVVKLSKLVYDHGGHEDRPPLFRVTVEFEEKDGGTKMDMRMTLPTPEAAEEARKFIKKAGGDATWDRLGEYLTKETTGKDTFVINRSFDAPIDVVFDMWTNPKHFAEWMGPKDSTMEYRRADIREGGSVFYLMTGAEGTKMHGRSEYLKIQKPDLIVYAQQFCDANERVSRHPMVPTWPETMLTTVTLTSEGSDRTRVTVTWEPTGAITREELMTFLQMRGGITQGWTGSFDKLEALLEKHS